MNGNFRSDQANEVFRSQPSRSVEAVAEAGRLRFQLIIEMLAKSPKASNPSRLIHRIKNSWLRAIDLHPRIDLDLRKTVSSTLKEDSSLSQIVDFVSEEPGGYYLPKNVANHLEFSLKVLWKLISPADIRFFYFRNLCDTYGIGYGPTTAGHFYEIGDELNERIRRCGAGLESTGYCEPLDYLEQLVKPLQASHEPRFIDAFMECCQAVNYFNLSFRAGRLLAKPRGLVDPEYLLSQVFSMPTSSDGLNQLFGGSGPLFTLRDGVASENLMPGRVALICGRFGTGKTVLAILLACEAARKGGIVWYFSTEQSIQEVLYTLKTVTCAAQRGVRIITNVHEAVRFLTMRPRDKASSGALILLSLREADSNNLWELLESHSEFGTEPERPVPLRLVVVDSLNAIAQPDPRDLPEASSSNIRYTLTHGLDKVTEGGMNVILLEEQSDQAPNADYRFVHNIADLVVELSIESPEVGTARGYARRYIQILKSRYQRDQRGRHSFSIRPPIGPHVSPSTAAVRARVASRRREARIIPGGFGLTAIDEILGYRDHRAGELTVIKGDQGTFKSPLAAAFLLAGSSDPRSGCKSGISLMLTMRYTQQQLLDLLESVADSETLNAYRAAPWIKICHLPIGFVTPGDILQLLKSEIDTSYQDGLNVNRIVLDDLGDWPNYSPFIGDDASFVPTLLDYLSRYPFLTLATLNQRFDDEDREIQRLVVEHASLLLEMERFEHGGQQRVMLRTVKSPRMNHRRESFEMHVNGQGLLQVDTRPSLFEVFNGEKLDFAGVQMFLQSESSQQCDYNQRIVKQLGATLSPAVRLDDPELLNGIGNLSEFPLSAITMLQILQVDGFRLRGERIDPRLPKLYPIRSHCSAIGSPLSTSQTPGRWIDRFEERTRPTNGEQAQERIAIPYYDNLSFLVFKEQAEAAILDENSNLTWDKIAACCSNHQDEQPYFDFPQGTGENYNCLFLEILSSVAGRQTQSIEELKQIVSQDEGLHAFELFWNVASPAYRDWHKRIRPTSKPGPDHLENADSFETEESNSTRLLNARYDVCAGASVWRHWFTTFHQMLNSFRGSPLSDGSGLRLNSLPDGWTTSGEWYLCVPASSAVPSAGGAIIELLSSAAAERERYELGVGLPVSRDQYGERQRFDESIDEWTAWKSWCATDVNLDFFSDLQQRQSKIIRRDLFDGYSALSPLLSNWLVRLLNKPTFVLDSSSDSKLLDSLKRILDRALGLALNSAKSPK